MNVRCASCGNGRVGPGGVPCAACGAKFDSAETSDDIATAADERVDLGALLAEAWRDGRLDAPALGAPQLFPAHFEAPPVALPVPEDPPPRHRRSLASTAAACIVIAGGVAFGTFELASSEPARPALEMPVAGAECPSERTLPAPCPETRERSAPADAPPTSPSPRPARRAATKAAGAAAVAPRAESRSAEIDPGSPRSANEGSAGPLASPTHGDAEGQRAEQAVVNEAHTDGGNANEASSSAALSPGSNDAPPFDRAAALAALGRAAAAAGACNASPPEGGARVAVTFLPSGAARDAVVEGPALQGTPAGACIARHFERLRVPAFSGSPITVRKTLVLR